ncbi:Uncharacterized protein dnm_095350 [Desulfonema magnum]|uniref:Uncharacterized protein n=1 Tax=Desulfonema magnum TaxID=45655 RepID=A0A975GTT2_9BACT|nr:Uncharacterized protein dnm_095350 [Desulfonema magnum]
MHQAKTAGRGLQPRPKRLFSGVGKYFGRGCKPRPAEADHRLIKTMSYDLSLMHMGRNPAFSGGGSLLSGEKSRVSLPCPTQSGNFSIY